MPQCRVPGSPCRPLRWPRSIFAPPRRHRLGGDYIREGPRYPATDLAHQWAKRASAPGQPLMKCGTGMGARPAATLMQGLCQVDAEAERPVFLGSSRAGPERGSAGKQHFLPTRRNFLHGGGEGCEFAPCEESKDPRTAASACPPSSGGGREAKQGTTQAATHFRITKTLLQKLLDTILNIYGSSG